MPPQDPNFDPSIIDINLSLAGTSSIDAINALVGAVDKLNAHMSQFAEQTRAEQLNTARQSYQRGQVQNSGLGPSARGSAPSSETPGYTPQHGTSESGSVPPENQPGVSSESMADAFARVRDQQVRDRTSPRPDFGGALEGERARQRAEEEEARQARIRERGWRLSDVVSSGRRGADPADERLDHRLRQAWRESRDAPTQMPGADTVFGAGGRLGRAVDLWNTRFTRDQGGGGSPSGSASVQESGGGPYFGSGGSIGSGGVVGSGYGGVGGGGVGGILRDPNDPLRHLGPEGMQGGGLTMPQELGGVYTPQFYLRLMSRHFGKSYLAGVDRGEGELGDPNITATQAWRARSGQLTAQAANNYATYHAAYQGIRGVLSRATGPDGPLGYSIRPGDVEATGEALGYERGQASIGVDGFGARIPGSQYLSEAGREGLRSRATRTGLAAGGNINRAQANEIVDSIEAFGWSGRERDTLAYAGLSPLVKQGQQAEDVMPLFDQALRRGNSSVSEIRNTLDHLGDTARRARIPMSELTQSIATSAEAWQRHGATFAQGAAASRGWTDITGLPPQLGAQQLDNPIIQGLTMSRTGMLPSQMAALGPSGVHGLTIESMEMMMDLSTGFNREQRTPIRDAQGNVISQQRVSGEEMQMRQAAEMAGIPYEDFQRMWKNRTRDRAAGELQNALGAFEMRQRGAGLPGDERLRDAVLRSRDQGGPGVRWEHIEGLLEKSGVSEEAIREVEQRPMQERAEAARRAMRQRDDDRGVRGKNRNQVMVKFTGAAEKVLEQVVPGVGGGDSKGLAGAGLDFVSAPFANPMGTGIKVAKGLIPGW